MSYHNPANGLTSVIIPCWNQLNFTQQCLAALKENTERAWELMDPVIAATEAADAPEPDFYAIGSQGPASAHKLLEADGRKWQPIR